MILIKYMKVSTELIIIISACNESVYFLTNSTVKKVLKFMTSVQLHMCGFVTDPFEILILPTFHE